MDEVAALTAELGAPDFPTRRNAAEALGDAGDARAIVPLLRLLGDDYWQVRNTVVDALAKIRDRSSIAPLLECLRDEDPGVRNSAMSALTEMGEDVAGPLTELLLRDPNVDVRIFSANTLGRLRQREGVAGLVQGLMDVDENVRYACAEGLGRLGYPEAAPPLARAMLREETWARFPHITALGLIGDERACPALTGMMDDDVLSFPAAVALGQIGDPAALAPLLRLLERADDDSVTRACVVSLAQVERRAAFFAKVEKEGYLHGRIVSDITSAITPALTETLVSMALRNDEAESGAARRLLRLTRGAVPVERLLGLLEDELIEEEVRDIIVRQGKPALKAVEAALEEGGDFNTVQLLRTVSVLGSEREAHIVARSLASPRPEEVCEALKCLGMLNAISHFDRMAPFLSSPNEEIRTAAVGGLMLLKKPPALVEKVAGLLSSPDPMQRRGGCRILGFLSKNEHGGLLAEALRDPSPEVRGAAAQSLGYMGALNKGLLTNPAVFENLRHIPLDEAPSVRIEGALAFSRIRLAPVLELLPDLFEDTDREVRSYAILAAGRCGLRDAAPALLRLLAREAEPQQRIFIIAALAGCGGPADAGELEPFLDDPVPEVAAEAATTIGAIGGPGAERMLLPLLEPGPWMIMDAAVNSLGKLNAVPAAGRVAAFLDEIADNPNRRILAHGALRTLGKIGGERELSALLPLLADEDCLYEAFDAAVAICARHGVLPDATALESPLARRLAWTIIGRTGGAGAAARRAAARDDEYPSARRAAALAMAAKGDSGWRDQWKNDPDYWVREIAERYFSAGGRHEDA